MAAESGLTVDDLAYMSRNVLEDITGHEDWPPDCKIISECFTLAAIAYRYDLNVTGLGQ